MNRIEKFLNKRSKKERFFISSFIALIIGNKLRNLDIKKIAGKEDMYRVRAGRFRIVFKKYKNRNTIVDISERDGNTYKNIKQ